MKGKTLWMLPLFPHKENNARENQALPPYPLTPSGLLGGRVKMPENHGKSQKNRERQQNGKMPILADLCLFLRKCLPKKPSMFTQKVIMGKKNLKIEPYDYNFDSL